MRIRWRNLLACWLLMISSGLALDSIRVDGVLDTASHSITGSVEVVFNGFPDETEELRFQLALPIHCRDTLGQVCGISIDSVLVDGRNMTAMSEVVRWNYVVKTDEPIPANTGIKTRLYFQTIVPEQASRFGYSADQYNLEVWYPYPAPRDDSGWLDVRYTEFAEPVWDFYDIGASLEVPAGWQVIAPGVQTITPTDSSSIAQLRLSPATNLALTIAQGMSELKASCEDVAVTVYYREGSAFAADTVLNVVCSSLAFMKEHVGEYPFDELVAVIGGYKAGGALELQRMIWLPQPAGGLYARGFQCSVIHEVVHQWFYAAVNSNQAEEPWLDESVTEYFTGVINDALNRRAGNYLNAYGFTADLMAQWRYIGHSRFEVVPISGSTVDYRMREYYIAVYQKGSLVMTTIGNLMGERQWAFWQEYYQTYRFKRPSAGDFVSLARRYLPDTSITKLEELIGTTGVIDFAVIDVVSERALVPDTGAEQAGNFEITVLYDIFNPPGYPVTMRAEYPDGSTWDTTFVPEPGRHELVFEGPMRPSAVSLDPDYVYAVDRNWLNNSRIMAGKEGSAARLFSGILFLVESVISTAWGF